MTLPAGHTLPHPSDEFHGSRFRALPIWGRLRPQPPIQFLAPPK